MNIHRAEGETTEAAAASRHAILTLQGIASGRRPV